MQSPTLIGTLSLCLLASPLWAGPEKVKEPGAYRQTMTEYFSGNRTANDQQFIRVYANETALKGKQMDGKLPYGSVLVGEIYSLKQVDDAAGQRLPDKLTTIVVMERGQGFDEGYPEPLTAGDWEFAAFSPDGKRLSADSTACRTCHHPLDAQEFVFTYSHLTP